MNNRAPENNNDDGSTSASSYYSIDDENDDDDAESGDDEFVAATSAPSVDTPPTPTVRQHSYLPGTSHPLHTTADMLRTTTTTTTRSTMTTTNAASNDGSATNHPFPWEQNHPSASPADDDVMTELTIVELPGVVLFPGMTLPLRFEESSSQQQHVLQMLRRQIQASRSSPGQASVVQLGVLTLVSPKDLQVSLDDTTTTTSNNNSNTRNINNDAIETITTNTTTNNNPIRRRGSWMRRTYGAERLRRFSEQLQEELQDLGEILLDLSDENLEDAPMEEEEDEDVATSTTRGGNRTTDRRSRFTNSAVSTPTTTTSGPQDDREFVHRRRRRRWSENDQSEVGTLDPYAYRIGTLATVTYTHETEHGSSSAPHRGGVQPRPPPLVLTLVGTSRFRILPETNHHHPHNGRWHSSMHYGHRWLTRRVESFGRERFHCAPQTPLNVLARPYQMMDPPNRLRHLSSVSSWPLPVYHQFWPWKLVRDIRDQLQHLAAGTSTATSTQQPHPRGRHGNNNSNNGPLSWLSSLLNEDNNPHHEIPHDPSSFSFWLATQLPLSEKQRLQILRRPTTTERLRWLLHYVTEDLETVIACHSCQLPLASGRDVFAVEGAEGSVGNYVNPHGIVHATMTVRNIDMDEVVLHGRPQVRDSWFPGYAWTIMSCRLCRSHLGWRFTAVRSQQRPAVHTLNRPLFFYGLPSTSVEVTTTNRNRRSSSRRQPSSTDR